MTLQWNTIHTLKKDSQMDLDDSASHPYQGGWFEHRPCVPDRHPYRSQRYDPDVWKRVVVELLQRLNGIDLNLKSGRETMETLMKSNAFDSIIAVNQVLRERYCMDWSAIDHIIHTTHDSDYDTVLILKTSEWQNKILTPKRSEILDTLRTTPVRSITHLAELLDRSRPNVVTDLNLLAHFGLIELRREGPRTVPILLKTEIRIIP